MTRETQRAGWLSRCPACDRLVNTFVNGRRCPHCAEATLPAAGAPPGSRQV